MKDDDLRAEFGSYLDSAVSSIKRIQRAGSNMQRLSSIKGRPGRPRKTIDSSRCDEHVAEALRACIELVSGWARERGHRAPMLYAVGVLAKRLNKSPDTIRDMMRPERRRAK